MDKGQFVKATESGWALLRLAAQVAKEPRAQYEQLPAFAANRAYIRFDGSIILGCKDTAWNVAKPLIRAGLLEQIDLNYARITPDGLAVIAATDHENK